jgi:glycogen debranching enzyme
MSSRFPDHAEWLEDAGLGHISEVADGDAPHVPGGCPFQAWSVGEALRVTQMLSNARAPSVAKGTAIRRQKVRRAV